MEVGKAVLLSMSKTIMPSYVVKNDRILSQTISCSTDVMSGYIGKDITWLPACSVIGRLGLSG